jgi:hypothetical protein
VYDFPVNRASHFYKREGRLSDPMATVFDRMSPPVTRSIRRFETGEAAWRAADWIASVKDGRRCEHERMTLGQPDAMPGRATGHESRRGVSSSSALARTSSSSRPRKPATSAGDIPRASASSKKTTSDFNHI